MPALTAAQLTTLPAEYHRTLLEATANHFELPASLCRIRNCRRLGVCRSRPGATDPSSEPPCIAGLNADHRATVEKLKTVLASICHGTLSPPPAKGGGNQWLQENAIAIMRAALPRMPDRIDVFRAWYRYFIAPPEPPIDTRSLLREVQAELIRSEYWLASMDIKHKARR